MSPQQFDQADDLAIMVQALQNMKQGAEGLAKTDTQYAARALKVAGRCEALIRHLQEGARAAALGEQGDPPIGMMEAPDQWQGRRQFCTAKLGDGRVGVAGGTWGKLGMIQILPALEPMFLDAKVSQENIAPGSGIMLLFKDREAVDRLVGMLQRIDWSKSQ